MIWASYLYLTKLDMLEFLFRKIVHFVSVYMQLVADDFSTVI